jgi:tetratricopeptide (TPR) repeat protein
MEGNMKIISKLLVAGFYFFLCAVSVSAACGEEAMKRDNWTDAYNDCVKAAGNNGNSISDRLSLADFAGKLLLFNVAAEQYAIIIELEQKDPAADLEARFNSLASMLTMMGDYKNAALMYRKTADLSEDGDRYLAFAKVLENNFKTGFKRTPEDPLTEKTIRSDQKIYEQIVPMSDAGKYAEALSEVTELIKRRPNFSNAIFMRGLILQKMKRFDESTKDMEHAVRLKPWDGLFNVFLAENYTELRNDQGCIDANTRIILNKEKLPFNKEQFVADAYSRRSICQSHDNSKYIQSQSDFLQYSWAVNKNGYEVGGHPLAGFALDNDCTIKNWDDPAANYDRGAELYGQKKFLCSIYSLDRAILMSEPASKLRATAIFTRAVAYDALSSESYEFSIQAARDYYRAGQLDPAKVAAGSYRSARIMFGVADKFIKRNMVKIGIYELAIPDFEKALKLSDVATQRDINYDLFNTRIRIFRGLVEELEKQKRKAAAVEATKLTEKLKAVAAKIEADHKVLSQDPAFAKDLLEPYTAFSVIYEAFKGLEKGDHQ